MQCNVWSVRCSGRYETRNSIFPVAHTVSARYFGTQRCHKLKAPLLLPGQEQGRLARHANTDLGLNKTCAHMARRAVSIASCSKRSIYITGRGRTNHPGQLLPDDLPPTTRKPNELSEKNESSNDSQPQSDGVPTADCSIAPVTTAPPLSKTKRPPFAVIPR